MASSAFRAPAPVSQRISRLYQLLVREKKDFEQVADHITDNALRCTVLSLAQQNNQYAAELSSYLQSTGTAGVPDQQVHRAKRSVAMATAVLTNESGVLAFCSSNEKKIAGAYRKILQEGALYEGLQEMIGYQLNGVLAACMQLKLLRSLTRHYHAKHTHGIA